MNPSLSSKQTVDVKNQSRFLPGLLLGFLLCSVFYLVYAIGFNTDDIARPIETVNANRQVNDENTTLIFLEKVKATYPQFEQKDRGALSVFISPQATYTVSTTRRQQVETSSQFFKNKLRDDLNSAGIAYNVVEGLGHWTILWNERLYLPAQ